MDREGRAQDLLSRVELVGLQTGINAFDLYSKDVREVFRTFCAGLAGAVQATLGPLGLCDSVQLAAAVQAVRAATASQRDAQMSKLDNALAGLLRATEGSAASAAAPAKERVEVLEALVAALQAARLLALTTADAAKPEPAATEAAPSGQAAGGAQPHKQHQGAAAPAPAQAQAASPAAGQEVAAAGRQLKVHAAEVSRALRLAAEALKVSRPAGQGEDGAPSTSGRPAGGGGASALPLLQQLVPRVQAAMASVGPAFLQPICRREDYTPQQLSVLGEMQTALTQEYALRRAVLIERAKVTLQSFEWSPRLAEKGTAQEAAGVAAAARRAMATQPQVSLEDVWTLRPADVVALTAVPTSTHVASALDGPAAGTAAAAAAGAAAAGGGRKRSAPMGVGIKSIIIGKVPDRGGRPDGRARESSDLAPPWRAVAGAEAEAGREVEAAAAEAGAGTGAAVEEAAAAGAGGRRAHEQAEEEAGAEAEVVGAVSMCRRVGWNECRAAGRAPAEEGEGGDGAPAAGGKAAGGTGEEGEVGVGAAADGAAAVEGEAEPQRSLLTVRRISQEYNMQPPYRSSRLVLLGLGLAALLALAGSAAGSKHQAESQEPIQSVNPDHPQEVTFKTPAVEVGEEEASHPGGWGLGQRIKEAVGSVIGGGRQAAEDVAASTAEAAATSHDAQTAKNAAMEAAERTRAAAANAADATRDAASHAAGAAGAAGDEARQRAGGAAGAAQDAAGKAADGVKSTARAAADKVVGAASAAKDAAAGAAGRAQEAASGAVHQTSEGVKGAGGAVKGTVGDAARSAQATAQGSAEAVADTASGMADKVASGIKSAAESVYNAAKSAVTGTQGAAETARVEASARAEEAEEQARHAASAASEQATITLQDVRQATQDAYAQATEAMQAVKQKVASSMPGAGGGDAGSDTGTTPAPWANEPQGNIELR
ncbi:hypothetical protein HYH02_007810 [Chlamydomonas schloesseri]|uniref:Uncharacterized protein n=1 Tax=Chlamydomonas schloesseri TaxID=2026947 RepID=A0A835WGA8_9CHLO|nr:hypothetical protein HYH02_007810 [Chlamydomonas schloesseri]|eukprot:KAG2447059.1 hypothetical protein HYH02_007810 [Chlamydomonas schloesseri]